MENFKEQRSSLPLRWATWPQTPLRRVQCVVLPAVQEGTPVPDTSRGHDDDHNDKKLTATAEPNHNVDNGFTVVLEET